MNLHNTQSMQFMNKRGYGVPDKLHKSQWHSEHNIGLYNTHTDTRRLTPFRLSKIKKKHIKGIAFLKPEEFFVAGMQAP